MALRNAQVAFLGTTANPHVQDAVEFVRRVLPETGPYTLWGLFDLVDRHGAVHAIDALVLGHHALYVIEIVTWPGRVTSPRLSDDWVVTWPDSGRQTVEPAPLTRAIHKARTLAGLLARGRSGALPHVEPLVLLAHPEVDCQLRGPARAKVVTRETFADAITRGRFPSPHGRLLERRVDRAQVAATRQALDALHLTPSQGRRSLDDLQLVELLEETTSYQDWLAVPDGDAGQGAPRRVRSYLVAPSLSTERRMQLRRAANREATVLSILGDHPNVLEVFETRQEGPFGGPCIVLEHLDGAEPLDVFLRRHPDLSFDERIELVVQIGEALAYCHNKKVLHRGLSPRAVLVRRQQGRFDVRLYNFQLSLRQAGTTHGTVHLSALSEQESVVFQAPELYVDPMRAGEASDLFSLGALAWFVLVGRPPGRTLSERFQLMPHGHLSVAAATDGIEAAADEAARRSVDAVVAQATRRQPVERFGDVREFLDALLEAAHERELEAAAELAAPALDPLEAVPGERLGDDIAVVSVLGAGASARVLQIVRGERSYALKVPLTPTAEARLDAEGDALERLADSEHVVDLVERIMLADRHCLIIDYAGQTLDHYLRERGTPPLDFAQRWGADLLGALVDLEERGVQHRDIKPANVGILEAAQKQRLRLKLFDFSLAGVAHGHIQVGTPAYRDPFLEVRGRWDAAADRYAAAITLHEMLTGARPLYGDDEGIDAIATDAPVVLRAEQFDAAVRNRLVAFFECALSREHDQRFVSAEAMARAWHQCFEDTGTAAMSATATPTTTLEGLTLATSIDVLPLSVRARNALSDRAGITDVAGLLGLPRNQISAIRGVGRETVREILELVGRIDTLGHLPSQHPDDAPLRPGYDGPNVGVIFADGLSSPVASALRDAALGTLAAVAAAPRTRVAHVLRDVPGGLAQLEAAFAAIEATGKAVQTLPATLEAWLGELVPAETGGRQRFLRTARRALGLDAARGGRYVHSARALAELMGKTPQAIYQAFGKARQHWQNHPEIFVLQDAVVQALEASGGVARLERAADALAAIIPPADAGLAVAERRRRAGALVQIAAEVREGLVLARPRAGDEADEATLVAVDTAHLDAARALGQVATELATTEPLPSSTAVRDALVEAASGGPLAGLGPEQLIAVAVDASAVAVPSARLELYPRQMSAERAVLLSGSALTNASVSPARLVELVESRYPEATALPGRPALDALVAPLGLRFDAASGHYRRPDTTGAARPSATHPGTSSTSSTRLVQRRATHGHGLPAVRTQDSPAVRAALDFETAVRLAIEDRDFRVLETDAALAEATARELAERFGHRLHVRSLDVELLGAIDEILLELGIDPPLAEVDRGGPSHPEWGNLVHLATLASQRVLDRLCAADAGVETLVLVHPGLLARYQLDGFFADLQQRLAAGDCPGALVIVPEAAGSTGPAVHTTAHARNLVVPVQRALCMQVPRAWVENRHRA